MCRISPCCVYGLGASVSMLVIFWVCGDRVERDRRWEYTSFFFALKKKKKKIYKTVFSFFEVLIIGGRPQKFLRRLSDGTQSHIQNVLTLAF